jgi:hypothetical protein
LQFQYITKHRKAKILFWAKQTRAVGARKETEFLLKIARETNLILAAREARATPQKHWRFLQIAAEKTAKISESLILAQIYHKARTFFQ